MLLGRPRPYRTLGSQIIDRWRHCVGSFWHRPIALNDIRSLIGQLKEHGLGVLITDHNVRETLELVDRVYILHDGKVLTSGEPDEVVQNDNVRQVYLGDAFRMR